MSGLTSPAGTSLTRSNSEPVHREKVDHDFDPLSQQSSRDDDEEAFVNKKTESLILRASDEGRVASAMNDASKKRKTGSIFSLTVELSSLGTLGLGVKVLRNNILAVSMLKRVNGILGPGEVAGARLGILNYRSLLLDLSLTL